jgi:hypothetical protein
VLSSAIYMYLGIITMYLGLSRGVRGPFRKFLVSFRNILLMRTLFHSGYICLSDINPILKLFWELEQEYWWWLCVLGMNIWSRLLAPNCWLWWCCQINSKKLESWPEAVQVVGRVTGPFRRLETHCWWKYRVGIGQRDMRSASCSVAETWSDMIKSLKACRS